MIRVTSCPITAQQTLISAPMIQRPLAPCPFTRGPKYGRSASTLQANRPTAAAAREFAANGKMRRSTHGASSSLSPLMPTAACSSWAALVASGQIISRWQRVLPRQPYDCIALRKDVQRRLPAASPQEQLFSSSAKFWSTPGIPCLTSNAVLASLHNTHQFAGNAGRTPISTRAYVVGNATR